MLLKYIDYALIVAGKPSSLPRTRSKSAGASKPKVAVVGSGMADCVTAYRLAPEFEVTMFESRDQIGLSGYKMKLGAELVDIPLRMMGECYYPRIMSMLKEVQIPVIGANTDTCFFVDDGIDFVQSRSPLPTLAVYFQNIFNVAR